MNRPQAGHEGGVRNVRRDALGLLAGASLAWAQAADAAKPAAAPPPPPPTGACSDCVGEIDSTLNACNLTSPSCVSSQNEDESHFEAPWQYEGSQKEAVKRLIKAVTGAVPAHLGSSQCHQHTSKVRKSTTEAHDAALALHSLHCS